MTPGEIISLKRLMFQDTQLGLKKCWNLSPLPYVYLICHTAHGNLNVPNSCWKWEGLCMECGTPTQAPKDLFCENFGSFRQGWRTCWKLLHTFCYKANPVLKFCIAQPENDEEAKWRKMKDKGRFLAAV